MGHGCVSVTTDDAFLCVSFKCFKTKRSKTTAERMSSCQSNEWSHSGLVCHRVQLQCGTRSQGDLFQNSSCAVKWAWRYLVSTSQLHGQAHVPSKYWKWIQAEKISFCFLLSRPVVTFFLSDIFPELNFCLQSRVSCGVPVWWRAGETDGIVPGPSQLFAPSNQTSPLLLPLRRNWKPAGLGMPSDVRSDVDV